MAARKSAATAQVDESVPAPTEKSTDKAGIHDAAGKVAPIKPEPKERSYLDALTPEHREFLQSQGKLS